MLNWALLVFGCVCAVACSSHVTSSVTEEGCHKSEVFFSGAGVDCAPCENICRDGQLEQPVCPEGCHAGCRCGRGLVRDASGNCTLGTSCRRGIEKT